MAGGMEHWQFKEKFLILPKTQQFPKCIPSSGLWLQIREFELSKVGISLAQNPENSSLILIYGEGGNIIFLLYSI